MKQFFPRKCASERGMTLIEVSVALMVMGTIIGGALAFYTSADQQRRQQRTYDNMDRIVRALSVYAESAGRVPCPADPSLSDQRFGWERNVTMAQLQVGANKYPTGSCDTTNFEGIVPFMTLNLDDSVARDGWNRYFTYAVSPQFARSNDQSHNVDGSINTASDVGTIHGRCRSEGWVGRYDGHNISAVKARFCCADQGFTGGGNYATEPWNALRFDNTTDLVINHTAGGALSPVRDAVDATPTTGSYQFMTVTNLDATGKLPAAMKNEAGTRILAPAFVLISYGLDGAGAYLANGTSGRYNTTAISAAEAENTNFATGNALEKRTYTDGPANRANGAAYYDDIVRWMTQDALMAAHGALSCQYP
jgi:prepilin-type N-terminal cleavage/methylation domain-containing protein